MLRRSLTQIFSLLSFINPLDEQFVHLQIYPSSVMGTPTAMPYPHPTPMINTHMLMSPYNHLYPSPVYPIPNGQLFYQSSPAIASFQQSLTTPYHPQPPAMLPGHPPHAPVAPHRTGPMTTNPDPYSQRLSPTSIQVPEMNLHELQQRFLEQQKHQPTPIAIHRQMSRPPVGEYTP